ncbi:hypothetical protein DOTSEDRAFT_74843 [Dothistroma septosporum NZE10]|uniref:Uncharacterized protein n=1 Tax=Dothistroma septosporum (strain NZE10 / CBS 128990) TaxID=675120 RepID=N1PFS4_DOTSN|nr:hypothetical protein DOTSEDRAFT_74843 [Dothistroma septosporum NZE10]
MRIPQIPVFATALLLGTAPIVSCFSFTGPSTSEPLGLNASSIDIFWNNDNTQYSQLDLHFTEEGGDGFSYTIAQNLSVSHGSFTWNPSNVSNALQSTKFKLPSGSDFNFMAMLHDANSTAGTTITSGNYRVTGYPYISAAASSLYPQSAAALLVMASAMFL